MSKIFFIFLIIFSSIVEASSLNPNCDILKKIQKTKIESLARDRTAKEISELTAEDQTKSITYQAEKFSIALEKMLPDAIASSLREIGIKPKDVASTLEGFSDLSSEKQLEVLDKIFEKMSYILKRPQEITDAKSVTERVKKYGVSRDDFNYLSKEFEKLSDEEIQDLKMAIALEIMENKQTKENVTERFSLVSRLKQWLGLETSPNSPQSRYPETSTESIKERVHFELSQVAKDELTNYLSQTSIYQIGEYVRQNLKKLSKNEIEEILSFLRSKDLQGSELYQILSEEKISLDILGERIVITEKILKKLKGPPFQLQLETNASISEMKDEIARKIIQLSLERSEKLKIIDEIKSLVSQRRISTQTSVPNEDFIKEYYQMLDENLKTTSVSSDIFLEKVAQFLKSKKGKISSSQAVQFITHALKTYDNRIRNRNRSSADIQRYLAILKQSIEDNNFVFSDEELVSFYAVLRETEFGTGYTHKDLIRFKKLSDRDEPLELDRLNKELKEVDLKISELSQVKEEVLRIEGFSEQVSPVQGKRREKRL